MLWWQRVWSVYQQLWTPSSQHKPLNRVAEHPQPYTAMCQLCLTLSMQSGCAWKPVNVTLCSKAYKLNQHIIESSTLRKFGTNTNNLMCALHDIKDIQKSTVKGCNTIYKKRKQFWLYWRLVLVLGLLHLSIKPRFDNTEMSCSWSLNINIAIVKKSHRFRRTQTWNSMYKQIFINSIFK